MECGRFALERAMVLRRPGFIMDPISGWRWAGRLLLTSNSKWKTLGWLVLGLGIATFIGLAGWRSGRTVLRCVLRSSFG